ncbi:MAG: aminopeptidase P family protein [Pseudomonadota bacterium]
MNSPTSPNAVTSPIPARIVQLRSAMREKGLDAYIIPSADPHLSEYLPQRWQGRARYSGFTGSVGTLIVTAGFAGLWVDSRYWEQAEKDLAPTGIQMMKIPSAAATMHIDWLAANMQSGQVVGIDGAVLGLATARALEQALSARQIRLDTGHDLLQHIWADRPAVPEAAVYEHLAPYAVVSRQEKLQLVREQMRAKGADWHFVSTVDDLAWIFNLRGSDVEYNPVFVAHALIGLHETTLFVSPAKVPADVTAALAKDGVLISAYENAAAALAALPESAGLLIDPRRITYGFRQAIPNAVKVIEAINPSVFAKSRKNAQEAQFVREAMEQDGAALCEFFAWFEQAQGKQRITELTIDEKLSAARARQPHYVSLSFNTIAGFNSNGAMPHYRATPESHSVIEGNGLLLIDSGGQYLNGTTDITRVVPVGTVSAEQKRDFTLVLKGMVALTRMQFPRGTFSPMLDTIARAPIWADGVNYGHGTGHGVGYFLNVHEGPQSISCYAMPEPQTAMEPGMITSNEPGIYRPGKWGVRIENLLLAVPAQTTEFGEYLKFETLTLCPIDTRCMDLGLLSEDEIGWINDYHATVLERLSPRVRGDAEAWLLERTKPVRK